MPRTRTAERLARKTGEAKAACLLSCLSAVPEVLPRFDYRIARGLAEDKGKLREQHEDAHLCSPELALFGVADGMGGHAAGEIAAALALNEVASSVASRTSQRAIEAYVARPSLQTRRNVFTRLRR